LKAALESAQAVEEKILKKAVERGKHEGLDKHERYKNPADPFYNNL